MCAQQAPPQHEHTSGFSGNSKTPDLPGLVIVNYGKQLLVDIISSCDYSALIVLGGHGAMHNTEVHGTGSDIDDDRVI